MNFNSDHNNLIEISSFFPHVKPMGGQHSHQTTNDDEIKMKRFQHKRTVGKKREIKGQANNNICNGPKSHTDNLLA